MTERNVDNGKPQGCLFTPCTTTKVYFRTTSLMAAWKMGRKKDSWRTWGFPDHIYPYTGPLASWNSTIPLACGLSLPLWPASGLCSRDIESTKVNSACHTWLKRHSPYPGLFVGHSVLLHEASEPQQGALVKQADLACKLPVDLQ